MGREVRMVRADWVHPRRDDGGWYIPLYGSSYSTAAKEFLEMANKDGLQEAVERHGGAPDKDRYMPEWSDTEKTHWMMYENTSEGTPLSPAFATPEELARWLADNGASSFGRMTATYEEWMGMIVGGGWAPSCVVENGVLRSGVAEVAKGGGK